MQTGKVASIFEAKNCHLSSIWLTEKLYNFPMLFLRHGSLGRHFLPKTSSLNSLPFMTLTCPRTNSFLMVQGHLLHYFSEIEDNDIYGRHCTMHNLFNYFACNSHMYSSQNQELVIFVISFSPKYKLKR